jgi:hypothetical protein
MSIGPVPSGGNVHPGGAQPNKSLPQNVKEALDHLDSTLKNSLDQVQTDKQMSAMNAAFNAALNAAMHKGEGPSAAFNAAANAAKNAASNAGENPASNAQTQLQSAVSTALKKNPSSAKAIESSLNTLSANLKTATSKINEDSSVTEVNDAAKSIADLVTNEIHHLQQK